jgi:LPS export ABC transporter protein LptC
VSRSFARRAAERADVLFRLFTVLAVIALAISTWVLSNPGRTPPATDEKRDQVPGYYLQNAVLTDFDERGDPSLKIAAERIDQVGHTTEVTLVDVRIDYDSPEGQNWTIFGDTAHVEPGDKIVDLNGNVRVLGTDPKHPGTAIVHTDAMSYDVTQQIASTKSDVRIDFERHTLTARGLIANLKERSLRLESRVNGRFLP